MINDVICPTCHQSDQVQKVSGLYNANTKEWVETDYRRDSDGDLRSYSEFHKAQTLLGQQLAPPKEPSPPASPNFALGVWGFILFVVFAAFCLPLSLIAVIPIGLIAFDPDQTIFPGSLHDFVARLPPWADTAALALLCLGGLITLVFLVWLVRFARRKYMQNKARYQQKKDEYDRQLLPGWQWAMERWENMYYCARDETVFVPGERSGVHVSEAQTFINRGMQP